MRRRSLLCALTVLLHKPVGAVRPAGEHSELFDRAVDSAERAGVRDEEGNPQRCQAPEVLPHVPLHAQNNQVRVESEKRLNAGVDHPTDMSFALEDGMQVVTRVKIMAQGFASDKITTEAAGAVIMTERSTWAPGVMILVDLGLG